MIIHAFFIHTTDETTNSCQDEVTIATQANFNVTSSTAGTPKSSVVVSTKQTSIHVTLPMNGTPKSFVPVSTTALIAGGAATGVVVLGLALVIILLVALFVRQNKKKLHTTNNRDVTYSNPVYWSK